VAPPTPAPAAAPTSPCTRTKARAARFVIGLDAIEDALTRIAASPVEQMSEQHRERIRHAFDGDEDARTDFDAFDAEQVIQVACFGHVIYG
jgi:hypothetical protein